MKFPRRNFLEFAGAAAAAPALSRSATAQAYPTRNITISMPTKQVFWLSLTIASVTITIASHWPQTNGFFDADDFLWLHLANWRSVIHSFVGTQGEHVAYRP